MDFLLWPSEARLDFVLGLTTAKIMERRLQTKARPIKAFPSRGPLLLYIYIEMYSTTRICLFLVQKVYPSSCRISTINSKGPIKKRSFKGDI